MTIRVLTWVSFTLLTLAVPNRAVAAMRVVTGSYTGTGPLGQSVAGLGFRPDVVIVKGNLGEEAVIKTTTMPGNLSKEMTGQAAAYSSGITSLGVDGFTVGNSPEVNQALVTYHYVAFQASPGELVVGSYVGNGNDDRSITGVGFQPGYMIVMNQADKEIVQRFPNQVGDASITFRNEAEKANRIQAFEPDGFELGNDSEANGSSGDTYHYVAWRMGPLTTGGVYAGNNTDNRNILGVGFQPVYVVVKNGQGSDVGAHRSAANAGDVTMHFDSNGHFSDGIQALLTDGFQVGRDPDVNRSGGMYHWVAFHESAADLAVNLSVDNAFPAVGDTITITVDLDNAGPSATSGVEVTDLLPAGLSYQFHSASQGAYVAGTGRWTVGNLVAGAGATLAITARVASGTEGSAITNTASVSASNAQDPGLGNNADSIIVNVRMSLIDEAGSLYPGSAVAGQPSLGLRIAVDNPASVGVTLSTTSTIAFSDSVNVYSAPLANPTYVPPFAVGFTLTFARAPVPGSIETGRLYDLVLALTGVTDGASPYAETIVTSGRNAILIEPTEVVLTATILGDRSGRPGERVDLLSIEVQNGYAATRTLDTLVVTNSTVGAGTTAQMDADLSIVSLYDDTDASGNLSASDIWLSSAPFSAGRAAFDVGGWILPASSVGHLVVAGDVDSTRARDGDMLDAIVAFASDVVFLEPTVVDPTITPLYPVDSYGDVTINGMVAHQVSLFPSLVDTLSSGDLNVLLATIVVPQNGYQADFLNALEVQDFSGGLAPGDFDALELYQDDGDGAFDPAQDALLGPLVFSGDRFEISGVGAGVVGSTLFFLVADVALTPGNGNTFQPAIPMNGIHVQSDNDGPLDAAVVSTQTLVIRAVQKVNVTSRPLPSSTRRPGSRNVPLLAIDIQNSTISTTVLDSLAFTNASSGSGSVAETDAAIAEVRVYADDGNGSVDPWDVMVVGGMRFTGGSLTTLPLSLALDPGTLSHLLITGSVDSSCTADGDTLAVRVAGPGALYFDSPQPVFGSFPMRTPATHRVDGMVAHQIHVFASSDSLVVTDPTDHLVFSFALDGNGYASDALTALTVRNVGSADADHIDRLALYRDGGDGVFGAGAGDDLYLVDLTDLGGKTYAGIGLSESLPAGCGTFAQFFVAADLNPAPATSASIQFEIPLMGIEVATGNDGPLDAPVQDPSVQLIPKPDEITVFPYSVGDKSVLPGSQLVLNFGIGFYNGFSNSVVLDAVEVFQAGDAVSSEMLGVTAYADTDTNGLFDPSVDMPVVTANSTSPFYALGNLGLTLTPKRITYMFLAYDLSGGVRDAVTVNFQINGEGDLKFVSSPVVRGEFPLNSPGIDRTNGMTAAQIELVAAPSLTVPPLETNMFVIGFTLPANGFLADQLQFVTVRSAGSAVAGQDVSAVNLWAENDGDDVFNAASDRVLAALNWTGSGWRNPLTLDEAVPTAGLRCYVTANVAAAAADDRTIQMLVPVNGIEMTSGNDGPVDGSVVNPGVQTISTDPLLSNLATDGASYSVGQAISVRMTVRNVGGTPLLGVHPSSPSMAGAGAATPQSGPIPASANLAAGEATTFVWTWVAASAGDLAFCGSAFNADSSEASSAGCSDPLAIQNRPASVAVEFTDEAPAGVNRGQRTVQAFRLSVRYAGFDSLSSSASLDRLALSITDNAGTPFPPNNVLSAITLVSTTGSNFTYTLVDSTSNPLRLALNTPIVLAPGDSVRLDIAFDVSPIAAFQPFRFSIDAKDDVVVTDANDGGTAPLISTDVFPWQTNVIDIADPADTLRVATTDTATVTVNVGQGDVVLWRGTLLNSGSVDAADEILTGLTFDFFDLAGAPIAPSDVLQELSIHAAGGTLYSTAAIPTAGARMVCPLDNVLLLPAQVARTIEVRIDIKSFPSQTGLFVTLAAPSSVQARDNNSGQAVVVAPLTTGAGFPMRSRTLRFEQPATGLIARRTSLAPPTILPAEAGVPILRIALGHADTTGATITFDSLAVRLTDPSGAPLAPGDFFNRVRVMHGANTIGSVTALSSVSPIVEFRLNPPLPIAAAASDSITVLVDAKSSFPPAAFQLRVEQGDIHAFDANEPSRVIGVAGSFPLSSESAWLRLPGNAVFCGLDSKMPPNASGGETGIVAFDFDIDNRSAAGYTSAEMRRLSVRVEDWKRRAFAPSRLIEAAYIVRDDSVIANGVVTAADISFALAPGAVVVAPDETVRLRLVFDVVATASDQSFRFFLADSTAMDLVDATTGTPVTATAESGYPMMTQLCHVLSASEAGGFTNYPNPFAAGRETTDITYFLEQPSRVTLRLYTLWGAPVATVLANAARTAGLHQGVTWSGRNEDGDVVNNGVYYLVLEIRPQSGGERKLTRKVGVVR